MRAFGGGSMSLPTVALIGRPNVGKSTLFNKIAGERIAIIEDVPGVTRDRLYQEVSYNNKILVELIWVVKLLTERLNSKL